MTPARLFGLNMGYFARVSETNVVQEVISISNVELGEPEKTFPETEKVGQDFIANVLGLRGEWKQTSFNSSFRGRFAGIGYRYDSDSGEFIPPEPLIKEDQELNALLDGLEDAPQQ